MLSLVTTELKIEGMSCAMCVGHVTRALGEVPGVTAANVDLEGGKASVQHDGADLAMMIAAVEEEGYEASATE